MSVLKAAKAHFKDRLSEELRCIEVPEWTEEDGNPVKIYFRPSMRLSQKSIILKHYNKDEFDKAIAYGLIFRCRDADGKRVFKEGQVDQIIDEIDPEIASWIIQQMDKDQPSVEDIKGN